MRKTLVFIASLTLFLALFTNNVTYAKSDYESYTWQKLNDYNTGRDIKSITNNGTVFIAVGEHGLILKSLDGITWEKVYCGYEEDFYNITWNGKEFKTISQNGKTLSSFSGDKWILLNQKSEVVTNSAISIDPQNKISQNKIFGWSKRANIAIAVGESGAIYYGTQKGQKPLKKAVLTTNSHIIDKLGNALVLCVGTSQMYVENNFVEESIPKPYTVKTGKIETAFVPLEKVVKGIGGSFKYDSNNSTAYVTYKTNKLVIKIGSKTIKQNGKDKNAPFPTVIKNNDIFVPLSTFSLLGKQIYFNQKLIVISDIKTFFNEDKELLTIETIASLCNSPDYLITSLSEKLIDTLEVEGIKLYYSYDSNGALEYFEIAEQIELSSEIYINLGLTCHNFENYYKAIDYFNKGIKLNCLSFDLYVYKGDSLSYLGEYDDALDCINQANKIRPEDNRLLISKANIDSYKGDYENAIKGFDECSLKDPTNAVPYFNKGYALMKLHKYQEAVNCFSKCIELDNKDIRPYWEKGKCLYELRKYTEAIVEFDNSLKLNPYAELILESKGDALFKLNKFEEAVVAYTRAIEIYHDYVPFHEKTGDALLALGRNDEAISEYDKALELELGFNEKLFEKEVELLYKMKRYDLLLDACKKFEQRDYDNEFINYYKALGYCAQGKYDDAMKYIKQAINDDREYRKKIKEDERFSKLKEREDYNELMSDIKFFMDDTFKAHGAEFFEQSMFDGINFCKASTLGTSSEDNTVKELINTIYVNLLNNKINDKETALKIGIYIDSPVLSIFDEENAKEQKPQFNTKEFKILSSEIIMCGNKNGMPRYVVIHIKQQRTNNLENIESDIYNLLIKDGAYWKFYDVIY